MRSLYSEIASRLYAAANCEKTANHEWHRRHIQQIRDWVKEHLPSGSGYDNGTQIDFQASTPEKLVFTTSYHHMNDVGMYDGWTEHVITVRPSLQHGIVLTVSGSNRNDIKDYIATTFAEALKSEVEK